MIEFLSGLLINCEDGHAVIDVNGVGYGFDYPKRQDYSSKIGTKSEVYIHTYVKEDALSLFGFDSVDERFMFKLLITISGVGPRLAMAILSTFCARDVVSYILSEDFNKLQVVSGVGLRQAKKIVVDLKPKLEKLQKTSTSSIFSGSDYYKDNGLLINLGADSANAKVLQEVNSALINLGYKDKEVVSVLKSFQTETKVIFNDILRLALQKLNRLNMSNPTTSLSDMEVQDKLF